MELYVSLSFLSAFLSLMMVFQIRYVDMKRKFARFIPVVISVAVWAFFSGMWLLVPLGYSMLMSKLSFLGIITLPVFLFCFALDYARSPLLFNKRLPYILWIIPGLSILMMFTNALHGLFWSDITSGMVFQDVEVMHFTPGSWYWVHSIYSYGLVAAALVLFLYNMRYKRFRKSHFGVVLGIIVPLITSLLFIFNLTPIDYSPLVLSFALLAFGWFITLGFYVRNISELEELQKETGRLNELYSLVVKLSEKLILTEPGQMDEVISQVLKQLGESSGVDRAYIFGYDKKKHEVSNTHEWCAEGISAEKENLQGIPFDVVPRWRDTLTINESIYIPLVADLPDTSLYEGEKQILMAQGIKSLVVVPMFNGQDFAGFVGFDSVREQKKWDKQIIALLKLTASIMAGGLARMHYERVLISALDKAESANRTKTEFLANMSHELRTPMNAIIGFTQLVEDQTSDPTLKKHLKTALKSSQSLLRLLNDLLDFSRAEAGMMHIQPDETRLKSLLEFVQDTFMPKLREKGLTLELNITPRAEKVFMLDEGRLRQVLFNVVGNAVKFTHKGHVEIIADAIPEPLSPKGKTAENKTLHTVIIDVKDTGIGIAREHHQKVFESFNQLSAGNNREYEGTGLGLNISSRLVKLMGGEIRLDSLPGRGSTFTIVLPAVEAI